MSALRDVQRLISRRSTAAANACGSRWAAATPSDEKELAVLDADEATCGSCYHGKSRHRWGRCHARDHLHVSEACTCTGFTNTYRHNSPDDNYGAW